MLIDSRTLPDGHQVAADVCIIGGGVAGTTLALELVNRNVDVCLLESGGWEPHPMTQTLGWGENLGHPYFDLDHARARCLGGSSARWDIGLGPGRLGVRLRPLDPIDFERREEVPHSGWPFDNAHMEPFYQRAEALCGVERYGYEREPWIGSGEPPLLSNNEVQTVIFKFVARDLFKQSHPETVARASNISVFQYATALEIETGQEARSVTGIRVGSLAGNRFRCRAKLYVVANGGIEAPRLLLLSNRRQTTGLGNGNDLVGRFFMEHYHFRSALFVPAATNGQGINELYRGTREVDGVPIVGKLALSERVLRREKLLNSCVQLIPHRMCAADLGQVLDRTAPQDGYWAKGRHLFRKIRKAIDRVRRAGPINVFRFANMSEQVPNPDSRITLSDQRDRLGQHCTRLDWRIGPEEIRSVYRTQEILARHVRQTGLGEVHVLMDQERPPAGLHGGYHHMGTTRMHTDPGQGVVDEHSRMHGMTNLYIAGSSVFPTGGYANPTLTTVALSIRLADRIKVVMDRGKGVSCSQERHGCVASGSE